MKSAQSRGKKKSAVVSFIPFVIIRNSGDSPDDLFGFYLPLRKKVDKTVIWRVFKKNNNRFNKEKELRGQYYWSRNSKVLLMFACS